MSIEGQGHFFTIYFQVLYVLYFTRPRHQVSVYRTTGPLVTTILIFYRGKVSKYASFMSSVDSISLVDIAYDYSGTVPISANFSFDQKPTHSRDPGLFEIVSITC